MWNHSLRYNFCTRMSRNTAWKVGESQRSPLCDTWRQFDPCDPDASFSRYSMLISCVVPRPIALVSTVGGNGAVSHDPMLVSITANMNGRGDNRTKKDTLINIEETSEFVVNIMSEWYVESANHTCGPFPYETDEISLSGLNTIPSTKVLPERIRESAVQLECKVHQYVPVWNDAKEHTCTMVIGRVVNIHVNETVLDATNNVVDLHKLQPIGRAGGNTYVTVGNSFDIARPKA